MIAKRRKKALAEAVWTRVDQADDGNWSSGP